LPKPRAGWAEAAKLARARDDDRMLDAPTTTRFEDDEWKYQRGRRQRNPMRSLVWLFHPTA
jgi:hypothetical protein